MKLLVVSGKPAVTRWIAGAVRTAWPIADVTFVHLVPYGNLRFSYPRGLALQDYPRISEPAYKLNSCAAWACPPLKMAVDGTLASCDMRMELFTEADLIVFAGDPSHADVGAFEVVMRDIFGDDRAMACPALEMYSFDQISLTRTFANIRPFGELFAETLQYGRIKRYFDFNWNMNALVVMGEAMRRAGVPADAPPLSKYALQLLYKMREEVSCLEDVVYQKMSRWEGTGRYQHPGEMRHLAVGSTSSRSQIIENLTGVGLLVHSKSRGVSQLTVPARGHALPPHMKGTWRPTLGSASSRHQIIENLTEAGLLVRNNSGGPSQLTVPARGHAFLELLHRDCQDRDLPFRVHAWCEEGEAAKPAIDRYIKTVFGKQLRFLFA